MSQPNYPPSFTQAEHDQYFAVDRSTPEAHEEECAFCREVIVYDSARNLWFKQEDFEIYGFRWLAYDAAVSAFKTDMGWICSTECWNDRCADDEDLIAPVLFLVKARTA